MDYRAGDHIYIKAVVKQVHRDGKLMVEFSETPRHPTTPVNYVNADEQGRFRWARKILLWPGSVAGFQPPVEIPTPTAVE